MTVAEMIEKLKAFPQDATISLCVGWADDTAISDPDEIKITNSDDKDVNEVEIRGWISNCSGDLEYGEEECGGGCEGCSCGPD